MLICIILNESLSGHNEVPPNWQDHWHIDGLGDHANKQKSSLYGDISNFTALVGMVVYICFSMFICVLCESFL